MPSGAFFYAFFGEGFPFQVNQKQDAVSCCCPMDIHWASEHVGGSARRTSTNGSEGLHIGDIGSVQQRPWDLHVILSLAAKSLLKRPGLGGGIQSCRLCFFVREGAKKLPGVLVQGMLVKQQTFPWAGHWWQGTVRSFHLFKNRLFISCWI